jgi:glycosyltransferase involved in cell wall biosynthesis
MSRQRTILLVAISNSIHTARWIAQFSDQGWNIHLFPSIVGAPVHTDINDITVHYLLHRKRVLSPRAKTRPGVGLLERGINAVHRRILAGMFPHWRARQLAGVVRRLRPDIVHSLEIQAAGYLTLSAKEFLNGHFPPWIVTNWGSDIFLFGRLQQHKERIRKVLETCDYYSCECKRDVELAKAFGFKKGFLPVIPNSGGFDLGSLEKSRRQVATSDRRIIMLRGYQDWAGRALAGLRALERCADALQEYSAAADVVMAAELFTAKTGVVTRILPVGISHDEILSFHAQARISIALSIGDAISTSLLEAMVMGSFPIQSCTACADEWLQQGVSGLIVPPEDPDIVERAIRTALSDDALVDRAAQINWQVAQTRLDGALLKQKAIDMYRSLVK